MPTGQIERSVGCCQATTSRRLVVPAACGEDATSPLRTLTADIEHPLLVDPKNLTDKRTTRHRQARNALDQLLHILLPDSLYLRDPVAACLIARHAQRLPSQLYEGGWSLGWVELESIGRALCDPAQDSSWLGQQAATNCFPDVVAEATGLVIASAETSTLVLVRGTRQQN